MDSIQYFMEPDAAVTNPTAQIQPVKIESSLETTYIFAAGTTPANDSWESVEPLPDADGQAYMRIDLDGVLMIY